MNPQRLTVTARQHDTVDALCHRHLGRTAGATEATLAANPGLAKVALDIPQGTPVRLVKAAAPTAKRINLWD